MQTGHSANHLHEGLITAQTSRYLQIIGSFDIHPPSAVSHSFTFRSLPLHPPSAVSHFIHLPQSPTSSTFRSLPLHPPSAVSHFIHLLQSPTSSTFCSLPLHPPSAVSHFIHPLRPGAAAGTCGAGAVLMSDERALNLKTRHKTLRRRVDSDMFYPKKPSVRTVVRNRPSLSTQVITCKALALQLNPSCRGSLPMVLA